MAESEVKVFRPKSLGGALRLYARNPDSLLFAGGTEIVPRLQRGYRRSLRFPEKVIYLGNVQELNRLSRSQRHLDIGAALDLSRILKLGRNVLPSVLFEALNQVGTPSVRNLATLGGNVCLYSGHGDCLPALSVIGGQLELRSSGSGRWTSLGSFFTERGRPGLRPGEMLTRVRIPLEEWDYQVYRKVGGRQHLGQSRLSFAAVARFPKGSIEALHLCFGGLRTPVLRVPELEARLKNVALPVAAKQVESLTAALEKILTGQIDESAEGLYRKATSLRLLRWFLESLNLRSLDVI